ncbi:peptidyl-alpha-hydroxyglycine alpha-amidating lyase 1 isoform X2 [Cephus cinctus]|nr:peptidyl-alpha-hydroxyglycine alpha-amidating lyase 1 isoform X2 [Cephus cinctus]
MHPLATGVPTNFSDKTDPNISWDSNWASDMKVGQISAVSIDPDGNIAVFHRGDRIWGSYTFDNENKFDRRYGPIQQNTIVLLDKTGKEILKWGSNMFYLPHGLTIDSLGNYWVTDVAMHQVFKFDAKDIKSNLERLKKMESAPKSAIFDNDNDNDLFRNSIIKPSLILGEAFVPGNDNKRFCKPSAVAVRNNGDFFVSDGYCNSRIIKFDKNGERILQWGRKWRPEDKTFQLLSPNVLFVPHALALAEEFNYILVADRENGRILCFYANNGTFYKEYKDPAIGTKIYSIAYAHEKIYLVNGKDPAIENSVHIRGFVLDLHTGYIVSQFTPGEDLTTPHSIAVTENGHEIYVVELSPHKIYRFLQGANGTASLPKTEVSQSENSSSASTIRHEPAPLTDIFVNDTSSDGNTATTLVLSLITTAVVLIALCVAIAAIVARCRKRGCLLTVRRRMRWEAERRENFKLSNLLETRKTKGFKFFKKRPNTRDFSKLNTEPETSEDEHPENSLTKVI